MQVADERGWLAGRGYDGRIICAQGQIHVVVLRRHVVDIETEQDGETFTL